MDTQVFLKLKKRRRTIENLLSQRKNEELSSESSQINEQIRKDPPTLEQVYISIGE